MSKLNARWINYDSQNLTSSGNNLAVLFSDGIAANSNTNWSSEKVKNYVDSLANGLLTKTASRAATTTALAACTYANGTAGVGATLTADANGALAAQDGITLAVSDILLVKNQVAPEENGIYSVVTVGDAGSQFILTRNTDFNDTNKIHGGSFTFIQEGTTQADSGWVMSADGTITVGTTGITWSQFSGAGAITAGTGLTKSGNELRIGDGTTGDVNGINRTADDISVATGLGLEVDTNVVRIATTAAGNGLTGGGAAALAVQPSDLITAGTAEIDGDQLDIDFTPTNYTPATDPAEVTDVDHLSAHLFGIDTAIAGISSENFKQEMHLITAGESTVGFFSLSETPINAQSVRVTIVSGGMKINKQVVGVTGVTADFDVINDIEIHFNNNGSATVLSENITTGDIAILEYQYTFAVVDSQFALDGSGDLMPPSDIGLVIDGSNLFDVDGNDDLIPSEDADNDEYFDLDGNDDVQPSA